MKSRRDFLVAFAKLGGRNGRVSAKNINNQDDPEENPGRLLQNLGSEKFDLLRLGLQSRLDKFLDVLRVPNFIL